MRIRVKIGVDRLCSSAAGPESGDDRGRPRRHVAAGEDAVEARHQGLGIDREAATVQRQARGRQRLGLDPLADGEDTSSASTVVRSLSSKLGAKQHWSSNTEVQCTSSMPTT